MFCRLRSVCTFVSLAPVILVACGDTPAAPAPVVDEPPVILPSIQYDTVFAGDLFELHIEATDDHGLASIRALWRDGTPASVVDASGATFEQVFPHVYAERGMYTVEFTAIDVRNQSAVGLAIVWVAVRDSLPTIEMTAPDTVLVGELWKLDLAIRDDVAIDRAIVDFGDGAPPIELIANNANCPPTCFGNMLAGPSTTYWDPGDYRVSVEAIDLIGQSATEWRMVVAVYPPPSP